jgi:hypothetical protein
MLLFSGVVIVALAGVGAGLYAQQKSNAPKKLSAEDWIEIRQLYSRYAQAVDGMNSEGDADKVASLWVEDGTWDNGPDNPPRRGRKEIASGYLNTYKRRFEGLNSPRRFFEDISVVIEASPEGAVGKSYFALVKSSAQDGQPSVIELNGEYHDVFVKTRDGWKFKSRVFRRIPGGAPAWPTAAR